VCPVAFSLKNSPLTFLSSIHLSGVKEYIFDILMSQRSDTELPAEETVKCSSWVTGCGLLVFIYLHSMKSAAVVKMLLGENSVL